MYAWLPVSVAARLMLMTPQHVLRLAKSKKLVGVFGDGPVYVSRESVEAMIGPLEDAQIKLARKKENI